MTLLSWSSDSHIIVNYGVLFHACSSAAVVSTSICDQFVRFMCQKLVCVLKAACVCVSPCRIGCWRTDWAPGFLRFLLVEANDKGKCEVRRGLSVLTAVCSVDGSRWMFEHQTDIKEQMAFMSSKIYLLNKLCRAPPAEFMALDTRNGYQCEFGCLAEVRGAFTQSKAWNISIILKGFRILGRNWVSFSKMVHSKAIHFSLTWNSALWKDRWQPLDGKW